MTLNWRLLLLAICVFGLATLAPLRRCHQCMVLAIGCKYTVITRQIDSGLRHQCGQFGDDKSAGQPICTTVGWRTGICAMKSTSSKMTCMDALMPRTHGCAGAAKWVVPSRYGVFSSYWT